MLSPTAASGLPSPGSWIDIVYDRTSRSLFSRSRRYQNGHSPLTIALVSLVFGGIVYLVGLLLAFSCGFTNVFFGTWALVYGAVGMAWVLGWIRWGLLRFGPSIYAVRVCFANDHEFDAAAQTTIARLNSK